MAHDLRPEGEERWSAKLGRTRRALLAAFARKSHHDHALSSAIRERAMTELRLQSSRVDWREVEGELIALARAESVYLAGNASAAILWRALADGTTETDLEALLVSTYGISAEAARADVAAFLADLGARGLLEAA